MNSKLRFSKFTKFVSWSLFGEFQLTQIPLSFNNSCCSLKIRGLGAKLWVAFPLSLFWKELWHFKVKESMFFCWTKTLTLIKARWYRKSKIPHAVLEKWTLCFSSSKNCELEIKLWWVGAYERKNSAFFVTFILTEWNFFNNCFILVYGVLNKLSETSYTFVTCF